MKFWVLASQLCMSILSSIHSQHVQFPSVAFKHFFHNIYTMWCLWLCDWIYYTTPIFFYSPEFDKVALSLIHHFPPFSVCVFYTVYSKGLNMELASYKCSIWWWWCDYYYCFIRSIKTLNQQYLSSPYYKERMELWKEW